MKKQLKKDNELAGRTILLVNTGTEKKSFIVKRLKELGLHIVALHTEKNWADEYVDDWIIANTNNEEECVKAVRKYIKSPDTLRIEGIVTFWESNVPLRSRLVDEFSFIGISYKNAMRAKNKYAFREFCLQEGLPSPKHYLLKKRSDIEKALEVVRFPLVAKPPFGAMSAYVVKVHNKQELYKIYDYIITNIRSYDKANEWKTVEDILIEEYIDGDEVDIDILLQNGKIKFHSISDNEATEEPFFVETGQSIPSNLPKKDQQALIDMAEEVLERLGIHHGCIHFEAKMTKKGPVPIEVNLRMGGDEVHSFVYGAWGIDMIEYSAKIALGVYIPLIHKPEAPLAYLAGKYFLCNSSGVVVKLSIDEKVKKSPYLEQLHTTKQVGDMVLVPPEGYDFMGWAVASGNNSMDAEDNLEKIMNGIEYEVSEFNPTSSLGKTERIDSFSNAYLTKTILKGMARIESIKHLTKGGKKELKIGILANLFPGSTDPMELHLTETAEHVKEALLKLGYEVKLFDMNNLQQTLLDLPTSEVDLVFNVAKRLNNSSLREANIAALCESLQLPYTGSSSLTLSLGKDKISTKKLMSYHHIPTPAWDYAYSTNDPVDKKLSYPLLVKPSNMYGSLGITKESVVRSEEELRKQLKKIIEEMGTCALVEEYIEGDEFDISIIGNGDDLKVLPLTKTIFTSKSKSNLHIYTYEDQWFPEKSKNSIIIERPAKDLSKKLESLLTELAFDMYRILGCQDYGRVEIRVDREGNPYVLELNVNPSLHKKSFFVQAALSNKIAYEDLIQQIIEAALRRYRTIKNPL